MKTTSKLWAGIVVLGILSPLGLLLPYHFKAGSAWGEWSAGELHGMVGYIPRGLVKLSALWRAPMSGYAFQGWHEKGIMHHGAAYLLSALLGIGIVVAAMVMLGRFLTKRSR